MELQSHSERGVVQRHVAVRNREPGHSVEQFQHLKGLQRDIDTHVLKAKECVQKISNRSQGRLDDDWNFSSPSRYLKPVNLRFFHICAYLYIYKRLSDLVKEVHFHIHNARDGLKELDSKLGNSTVSGSPSSVECKKISLELNQWEDKFSINQFNFCRAIGLRTILEFLLASLALVSFCSVIYMYLYLVETDEIWKYTFLLNSFLFFIHSTDGFKKTKRPILWALRACHIAMFFIWDEHLQLHLATFYTILMYVTIVAEGNVIPEFISCYSYFHFAIVALLVIPVTGRYITFMDCLSVSFLALSLNNLIVGELWKAFFPFLAWYASTKNSFLFVFVIFNFNNVYALYLLLNYVGFNFWKIMGD